MGKEENSEMRVSILLDQLERARGAVDDYQDARLSLMNRGGLVMLVLLILAYTKWATMSALSLPFVALYLVVQYGYLTHRIICGRAQVAAVESKINAEVGETLLTSEAVESKHFGPLGDSHFLGVSASNLTGIFGASSLHFLILCFVMFVGGYLRGSHMLAKPEMWQIGRLANVYVPLLILWTLANVGYLVWFSALGIREKNIIATIRTPGEPRDE